MEALLRHWNILRQIPRLPRKIDTNRLRENLNALGFEVSLRTIQRDLNALSRVFPLQSDEARPTGWYWEKYVEAFDIPGLHPHEAVTFLLVRDFLATMLPPGCSEHLESHFVRAGKVLDNLSGGLSQWSDQISVVSRTQPLLPPVISEQVMDTVYEALLHQRQLTFRYRRRGDSQCKEYEAHPQGLIFADQVIYLACTLYHFDDIKLFVLHRMEEATLVDTPARKLVDFNLRSYIDSGAMGFARNLQPITIALRFDPVAAAHLIDTPLSHDQQLHRDDDFTTVTATVSDNAQLRWWILGFGELVEVLAPEALRLEIAQKCHKMAQQYQLNQETIPC